MLLNRFKERNVGWLYEREATKCRFHFASIFFFKKSFLGSFSLLTIWLYNFLVREYGRKAVPKMLVNLTTGFCHPSCPLWTSRVGQFHQHFTRAFFVVLYAAFLQLRFWRKYIGEKIARKMLMKLTKGGRMAEFSPTCLLLFIFVLAVINIGRFFPLPILWNRHLRI